MREHSTIYRLFNNKSNRQTSRDNLHISIARTRKYSVKIGIRSFKIFYPRTRNLFVSVCHCRLLTSDYTRTSHHRMTTFVPFDIEQVLCRKYCFCYRKKKPFDISGGRESFGALRTASIHVCIYAFAYLPNALDNTADDAAAIQHSVSRVRITRYYYVHLFKRRVNRFKTRRGKRIFHCVFPREFTPERCGTRAIGGGWGKGRTHKRQYYLVDSPSAAVFRRPFRRRLRRDGSECSSPTRGGKNSRTRLYRVFRKGRVIRVQTCKRNPETGLGFDGRLKENRAQVDSVSE